MAQKIKSAIQASFLLLVFTGLVSYFFMVTRANAQGSRRLEREAALVRGRTAVVESGLDDLKRRLNRIENILLRIDRKVNGGKHGLGAGSQRGPDNQAGGVDDALHAVGD